LLKTEHPGKSSVTGMHHPAGVHTEIVRGENGDDGDSMHKDSDMGLDESASSPDMDDDDDCDDDETEADSSGVDAESISDIVLDVHNIRVKYKVTIWFCNLGNIYCLGDLSQEVMCSFKQDTSKKKQQVKSAIQR
jgi:hypothetical protein